MINIEAIRGGLTRGEFFLEYLPAVCLADGRCTGAEALIRWRRPPGVVPPSAFIPLAENTPLSGLITYWVIDAVTTDLADWLRANRQAYISINVPPEILGRGGMEYAATNSGLIGLSKQLILEVTERGVPDMMGVEALNNIWGRHVRVALDDVTLVGVANLAVLARCHFGIIKLDQSLIMQIAPNLPAPDWLEGIAAIVRSSRIQIIAEGVETELQARMLTDADIQYAQGYYFARPLPLAAFKAYHRETQVAEPNGTLQQAGGRRFAFRGS